LAASSDFSPDCRRARRARPRAQLVDPGHPGCGGTIAIGAGDAFIAGGTETISRVPMMGFNIIPLPSWSLDEVLDFVNVELAERIPERFGLPRKEQERFAYKSLAKAMKAQQAGKLADEIAPVKGGNALVAVNGRVRETPPQQLVDLKLPFRADGTVTAGTSSPLTDGATAVFVCSESYVEERGFAPLARTRSFAMSGRALSVMDLGSIGSSCELLARAKLTMDDIDIVEIIEAFVPPRPRDPRGEGHHRRRRDRARPSARRARRRLVGKVSPLLKLEKDAMRWATQCMGGGVGIAMELVAV
jgi:acetyl-CoA acyltransferase